MSRSQELIISDIYFVIICATYLIFKYCLVTQLSSYHFRSFLVQPFVKHEEMTHISINTIDKINFNNEVWKIVLEIPEGKVATYGQIASIVKKPENIADNIYRSFSSRWVGAAMAVCPDNVPWHRVVNSQGKISIRGEGSIIQKQRLEAEGVIFDEKGRINLKRYQWHVSEPKTNQTKLPF